MIGTFLTEKLLDEAYNLAKREGEKVIDKVLGNDDLGKIVIKCINEVRKDDGLEKLTDAQEDTLKEHAKEKLKVNIKYQEFKEYISANTELFADIQKQEEFVEKVYVKYQCRVTEKLNLLMIDQDIHEVGDLVKEECRTLKEGQERMKEEIKGEIQKKNQILDSLNITMESQTYSSVIFLVSEPVSFEEIDNYLSEDYIVEYDQYEDDGKHYVYFNFFDPENSDVVKIFLGDIDIFFVEQDVTVYEVEVKQ